MKKNKPKKFQNRKDLGSVEGIVEQTDPKKYGDEKKANSKSFKPFKRAIIRFVLVLFIVGLVLFGVNQGSVRNSFSGIYNRLNAMKTVVTGQANSDMSDLELTPQNIHKQVLGVDTEISQSQIYIDTNNGRIEIPSEQFNYIGEEIYVISDSGTFVLNSGHIRDFLTTCLFIDGEEKIEGADMNDGQGNQGPGEDQQSQKLSKRLLCVEVGKVRSFVENNRNLLVEQSREMKTISNSKGEFNYYSNDLSVDYEALVENIVSILTQRIDMSEIIFGDEDDGNLSSIVSTDRGESIDLADIAIPNNISPSFEQGPGTNGDYSDKYIEIDHSQQMIYVWEDGKLKYEWGVSGVRDEYAVFGIFEVGEKATRAWSDIAQKWMPYWMSYYYDPIQETWFGLHGLVWWEDADGVHYEPESNIGIKRSGGCIRVTVENAKTLYEWAEPGTRILIHP